MDLLKKYLIRFNQILLETHTYAFFSKKDVHKHACEITSPAFGTRSRQLCAYTKTGVKRIGLSD